MATLFARQAFTYEVICSSVSAAGSGWFFLLSIGMHGSIIFGYDFFVQCHVIVANYLQKGVDIVIISFTTCSYGF